jgi:hypothetical protein
MRQTWRNAGIWAFAGLFGCISLLGPGWHCVWGHHFHGPAACHDHEHSADQQDPDHQDRGHQDRGHQDRGHEHAGCHAHEDEGGLLVRSVAGEHDCPLCRFFAQAQWTFECDPPDSAPSTIENLCPAGRSASTVRVGLYQSRAPPAFLC